ncbi:MAG TPA: DUF433 domain-containing protein [Candidatus Saccharimonadales bacterium]|nr:DUF433 domain-containing protein [Candidatus Saccharimonadales bacterium]
MKHLPRFKRYEHAIYANHYRPATDGRCTLHQRDVRIPVATVVEMIAEGMETPQILQAYPDLEADDIREALRFAGEAVRERVLPLLPNQ